MIHQLLGDLPRKRTIQSTISGCIRAEDRDALADENRRRAQLHRCRSVTRLASCQAEHAQVVELELEIHDS